MIAILSVVSMELIVKNSNVNTRDDLSEFKEWEDKPHAKE